MIILGIDPGISGAIAFYGTNIPGSIDALDVPTVNGEIDAVYLGRMITAGRPSVAIIELVSAMPKQGVSSTFKFGRAFGTVLGVLGALQVPYHMVSPTRWKKHFRLSADKEQARALAIRTWPSSEAFRRKKDHGRAEAALLAKYYAETQSFTTLSPARAAS